MIDELVIRDLGVIAEATLPLGPGFTAVTGETGAGKTMVVQALGLLLGERADAGAVRSGASAAWVEGRWRISGEGPVALRVDELGGEIEAFEGGAELLVSRSVTAEGRSRAVVGGRGAPVGALAEIGEHLVAVHGQSEQLRLKSAVAQRDALDHYAGVPIARELASYSAVFDRWTRDRAELDRLVGEREARIREAESIRAAVLEIEDVQPQPDEDVELADRANRLTNLEDLRLAASAAHEALSSESMDGGADVLALLGETRRQLERVASHDSTAAELAESAEGLVYQASDLATAVASYLSGLDSDGAGELDVIQERRAALAGLARKYGPTLDDVIGYFDTAGQRLLELDGDGDRIARLSESVEADEALVYELAGRITAERTAAAEALSEAVTGELAQLAMPDAQVRVEVTGDEPPSAAGRDSIQFLLRPHSGSEPRPISRGASGGELSRVMLAIEVVLAATDPVPTFVFDEVDAGVGGAAAIEIGRRLARLAKSSQVIVVTHLAQVAAFATNHLTVVKDRSGAVTSSSVVRLEGDARTAEMARLLSGLPDSDTGLSHARELLALAADRSD